MRKLLPDPTKQNTLRREFSLDSHGRLEIEGESVIRHVTPELFSIFEKLKASGRLDALHRAGMIQTDASDAHPNALVHEFVPYVTYPQEWTLELLRDSALCTLDVAIELAEEGLRLHDGSPWNVTFVNGEAKFIDFSSIEPGVYDGGFTHHFLSLFYIPLWLRNKRQFKLSRMIAAEDHYFGGPMGARATGRFLFHPKLLGRMCWRYRWLASRLKRAKDPGSALRALRDHVAGMNLPSPRTEWGQYDEPGGDYDDLDSYGGKAKAVRSLIERLPKGKLVDVAANKGWFAGLARTLGHQVMGVDLDENAVNKMRENARKYGFDCSFMNILWPTPPQGRFLQLPSVMERFQCDSMIMIALSHHLVLRQSITFEALAAIPVSFGVKDLIIEWIPPDDRYVRDWPRQQGIEIPDWYTEANFVGAFTKHFPEHHRVESDVRDSDGTGIRYLYHFKRQA
ncbi:MAG: hypothetical protein AB8B91_06605 [Rubripirellula sp.]